MEIIGRQAVGRGLVEKKAVRRKQREIGKHKEAGREEIMYKETARKEQIQRSG
jgi:hypothetical protein